MAWPWAAADCSSPTAEPERWCEWTSPRVRRRSSPIPTRGNASTARTISSLARNGDVYFTDPPYGLAGVQQSPLRELTYTGVFRVTPDNQVHLIADNLFPNGIALSPDNRVVYATDNSGWVAIDLDPSGMPKGQRPFVASASVGGARGDGMKADSAGNIWTSGRGGIYVFSAEGRTHRLRPDRGPRLELRVRA